MHPQAEHRHRQGKGVSDGTRTRGRRDHNPELYQLSYAHQADCRANLAAHGGPPKAPCDWTGGADRATTECDAVVMLVERATRSARAASAAREPWILTAFDWVLPVAGADRLAVRGEPLRGRVGGRRARLRGDRHRRLARAEGAAGRRAQQEPPVAPPLRCA